MRPLSCLSCEHHRPAGCALRRSGWPTLWLASCSDGCYAPGADEREDRDLRDNWQRDDDRAEARNAR